MRSSATRWLRSPLPERIGSQPCGQEASEMSKRADSNLPESSTDAGLEVHWVALAIPLAVAMIFGMLGLVCVWLDVLV
jgi:hypothetical protein